MFNKARDENAQQADAEKKKLEKEALKEQAAASASSKRENTDLNTPKDIKAMIRDQYLSAKQRETRNNGTGWCEGEFRDVAAFLQLSYGIIAKFLLVANQFGIYGHDYLN